jgi:hypothetical protein
VSLEEVETSLTIRVEPPTKTISWTSDLSILESQRTFSTGSRVPRNRSWQSSSKRARVREVYRSRYPQKESRSQYSIIQQLIPPKTRQSGSPSRHLLRVTLSTAQYRMTTVKEDPLMGEASERAASQTGPGSNNR